jgi:hypothetical protein
MTVLSMAGGSMSNTPRHDSKQSDHAEPLPERDTRKPQERKPDKTGQAASVRQNTHNQGYQQDR